MKRNKRNFRNRIMAGILSLCIVLTCFSSVSNATTTLAPEEQFRQLCLRLYETGDHSVQDITDLNLPYMTCFDIINEVRANEGFLAYQCYENYQLMEIDEMEYLGTKVDQVFLRKFHLGETEDTNFAKRYAYIHEVIAEMKSTFDDKMTDLDKLVWIHEYIDEKIYYKDANTLKEHLAVPALMQGYGVCESYARLLMLFLKEFDIPCQPISGGAHAWVAVKIDGKWYHVDPTWDDTGACSGAHHYFLMRNDEEYRSTLNHLHTWSQESNYTDEVSKTISTSTDYTDWYVHNVPNKMYYYDGYWYYVLNNAVRKNNIQGTDETIICEGNNLSVKGIEHGVLTYSVGSEKKQLILTDSEAAKKQFRQLYLRLLETGDYSQQDITELNLPYNTCFDIMLDVWENEGFRAGQCYASRESNCTIQMDKYVSINNEIYLQKFHLGKNVDPNFSERYTKINEVVANMKNSFDDKMTDLDKLVWINEYIVENVNYKNTGSSTDYYAVPTLLNGYGVCSGYASLMMLFLKECGIPCKMVCGGNHGWVSVNIDGKWYHADPTWDDTYAGSKGTHYFLMRNDDEFRNTMSVKHTWTDETDYYTGEVSTTVSTSTEYTDWYVHNVWKRMYYYDGYWYYISDNAVKKNTIKGTDETIICEGNNLSIKGIENGTLTYSVGSEEKQLVLKNNDTDKTTEATTQNTSSTEKTTEVTTQNTSSTEKTTEVSTEIEKDDDDNDENADDNASPSSKKAKSRIPVIKSVTNKKGNKVKIVLKKKIAGADGYQVAYSTNRSFKKSVKKVNFKGTSKTISKLRKKKTYYIKVRAYQKNASGKKVYSKYSKVKKIKIKR